MKTKKITLFYRLRKKEVIPPEKVAIERKDEWIHEIQATMKNKDEKIIKLTYELHNPDILQQIRFFNGPVVEYFTIQNLDMLEGRPDRTQITLYRETMLDNALGYDLQLLDRVARRRRSTGDFRSTQEWHDFLETLRETHFEPQGYEFPDSEHFWDVTGKSTYDKAKETVIKELQARLKKKLSPPKMEENAIEE